MLGSLLRGLWARGRERGNPLEEYFRNNPGRAMYKWTHYFDIYHRHLAPYRGRSPIVLEIGVYHGGSLQMWRRYFGPGTRIVGVDIDPRCREFEADGVSILIGDQTDRAFLASLRGRLPRIDILIDDGGHRMDQQIATFEELYPHIHPEGIYLCEDVHTSYVAKYGGGYRQPGTFIEYAKGLVDPLHGWYTDPERVDAMTRSTHGVHFYDSVVVIEKRPKSRPELVKTGVAPF